MQPAVPREVSESIKRFLRELSKLARVEQVYLFGSYARGDWIKTSDIDLIVVSSDFEGTRFLDRLDMVNKAAWRAFSRPPIEAIPLTPKELKEKEERSAAIRDARKYWIKIG